MPIEYHDGNQIKRAIGVDVIKVKNQYNAILNNKLIVKIYFEVSNTEALMKINKKEPSIEIQQQILNTQQVINAAISRINDSGSLGLDNVGGVSFPSLGEPQRQSPTMNGNKFHNSEEILYTDNWEGQEKKGFAYANWQGLFLNSSRNLPLKLIFKKE